MKHTIGATLLMAVVFPLLVRAQTVVDVPGYYETSGIEGTLNTAVTNAINAERYPRPFFKLKQFGKIHSYRNNNRSGWTTSYHRRG